MRQVARARHDDAANLEPPDDRCLVRVLDLERRAGETGEQRDELRPEPPQRDARQLARVPGNNLHNAPFGDQDSARLAALGLPAPRHLRPWIVATPREEKRGLSPCE